MAKDTTPNPSAAFNEMVTQWERNYDAFANQLMGTEGFSQAMNEMQKAQLNYQQTFAQSMTQNLASMNLPSRDDIMNLADSIRQLDLRMERIEASLAASNSGKKSAPVKKKKPARTKQPPSEE